jgi:hypothetical protein
LDDFEALAVSLVPWSWLAFLDDFEALAVSLVPWSWLAFLDDFEALAVSLVPWSWLAFLDDLEVLAGSLVPLSWLLGPLEDLGAFNPFLEFALDTTGAFSLLFFFFGSSSFLAMARDDELINSGADINFVEYCFSSPLASPTSEPSETSLSLSLPLSLPLELSVPLPLLLLLLVQVPLPLVPLLPLRTVPSLSESDSLQSEEVSASLGSSPSFCESFLARDTAVVLDEEAATSFPTNLKSEDSLNTPEEPSGV